MYFLFFQSILFLEMYGIILHKCLGVNEDCKTNVNIFTNGECTQKIKSLNPISMEICLNFEKVNKPIPTANQYILCVLRLYSFVAV